MLVESMDEKAEDRERQYQKEWRKKNKQYCREYSKKWRSENVEERRKYLRKYMRNWSKKNKDKVKIARINWRTRNPWVKSYTSAKNRCRSYGKYAKMGRKFLMSVKDFKILWFRDKAYLMGRPSIDRIDNNGHYEISNCRFIEISENHRFSAKTTRRLKP